MNLVDLVLFTVKGEQLSVVLWRRGWAPFEGQLALPGGVLRQADGEDDMLALTRIVNEKIDLSGVYVEQLMSKTSATRDPRGWTRTVVYFGVLPYSRLVDTDGVSCEVVPVTVRSMESLAFDHAEFVAQGLQRLSSKTAYSSLPVFLCGETFTIPELKRQYEIIQGRAIPRTEFDRLLAKLGILEKLGEKAGVSGRKADLYRVALQYKTSLSYID